jgi:hypothetical protein
MRKRLNYSLILFLISGSMSYGSGAQPCSAFVSTDHQSFLLSQAFKASDLVVIGEVTYSPKPILNIKTKIKGREEKKQVELTSVVCQGTACRGGFSVGTKVNLLFLLKKSGDVYDSVSGNGNFDCPVVYEIENNFVNFKDHKISTQSLEKYLKTNPASIPLF